jgi:hypothetical protein
MKGFLIGLLVAIISFFVFFFFMPNLADRYLGVSMQNGEVAREIQPVITEVKKTTVNTVSTVSDGIQNLIRNSNGN